MMTSDPMMTSLRKTSLVWYGVPGIIDVPRPEIIGTYTYLLANVKSV
jgi:hypothetical protein